MYMIALFSVYVIIDLALPVLFRLNW